MTNSVIPIKQPQVTPASRVEADRANLVKNFDTFLNILTTQLSHQNPLSPLETHRFTEQLVQFASVEQQLAQRDSLARIETAMLHSASSYAVNYLGTRVHSQGNVFETRKGFGELSFKLPEQAVQARLEIINPKDQTVLHEADISAHNDGQWFVYRWDGLLPPDEEGGLPSYVGDDLRFIARIRALDGDRQPLEAEIKGMRTIVSVDLAGGSPIFGFDDGTTSDMASISRVSI